MGGYFPGGNFPGGDCPGGNCPTTFFLHMHGLDEKKDKRKDKTIFRM